MGCLLGGRGYYFQLILWEAFSHYLQCKQENITFVTKDNNSGE
jgi:uncharacterized membrane protein YiaA